MMCCGYQLCNMVYQPLYVFFLSIHYETFLFLFCVFLDANQIDKIIIWVDCEILDTESDVFMFLEQSTHPSHQFNS
ncbi:hypothetical protein QVD17_26020 [Tagetes erecta]|uniref:Uncharacterized protein n=1 Tax=Tagetes erecta TaxID=13708 RepID=A0AAD8K8K0_TARER|nr:hypothetical protein QVD17_26020 [Tagetes erecta]